MRMRNPFSGDSEEEKDSGDEAQEESSAERAQETRVSETRAGDESPSATNGSGSSEDGSSGSDSPEAGPSDSDSPSAGSSDTGSSDTGSDGGEQELTAPSVGPHTTFDKEPPEERLDFDKISDTDAMGEDKRREVVGGTYGPTKTRVFATFAAFFLAVGALAAGVYFLAKELDQPPAENPDVAPWSQADAPQSPPKELQ